MILKKSRASILIFTLLILSVITILTEQLVRMVLVNYSFTSSQVKKEQARSIAIGAVNLAISQLLDKENIEGKDRKEESTAQESTAQESDTQEMDFKLYLKRVLPNINRMQKFKLVESLDGIDGEVGFCITCENGKININKIFDFEKNEFKDEYKKILAGLEIKGKLKAGEILKRLTEFLKERKRPLDDVSQLSRIKGLENLDLLYSPPLLSEGKNKLKPNNNIYLQDLFTIWTNSELVEFLFLSNSMLRIFGLRQPLANDSVVLEKQFEKMIKGIQKNYSDNLNNNWADYVSIFGKNNKELERIKPILSKEFGAKVFSVLSYGKVDDVKEKLLVILKEVEKSKEEEKKQGNSTSNQSLVNKQDQESSKTFRIVRMYWI